MKLSPNSPTIKRQENNIKKHSYLVGRTPCVTISVAELKVLIKAATR